MKALLYLFFSFVLLGMLWVTVTASMERSVLQAASEIWADPWGKATLFDAYFAFLTVFIWIAYREPNWLRRGIWLVLLLVLGNFAIAAYFLIALKRLPPSTPWTGLFEKPETHRP